MSLLFLFTIYPSKDMTLTHKYGDVKTPARRFCDKKKIKVLDANKERKQSCRHLAEMLNIGKTGASNIIKNETCIRKEYEEFKGDLKRKRKGQFNDINQVLYEWFEKCCAANVYLDGLMLKEEATEIKKCLDKVEFKTFTASNGWLEKWKIPYGV